MHSEPAPIAPEELLAHAGFLARLARELTRDAESAADLVQETWRVALERPPSSARERGSLRGWLATVAANLARNRRRSERRRDAREAAAARDERIEPDALALERLEVQRALVELVLALPPEQRTVLHLRYFEDLPPRAIAERLGAPLKTVKARQARALAALRERLDARAHGDRSRWLAALVPLARTAKGGALIGGLAMKKTVATVVAALVALAGWRALRQDGEHFDASPATDQIELAAATAPPAPLEPELVPELVAAGEREPAESVSASARSTTTGGLDIVLRRADGSLAADVPLAVDSVEDPAPRVRFHRTRTDAEGRALVEGLPPGRARVFWLDVDRFDVEVLAGTNRAIELTVPDGVDVTGTVVDAAGAPVAGAEIRGGNSNRIWPGGFLLGRSAADGSFAIRDLDPHCPVGARKRGHVASYCEAPSNVEVGDDGARHLRLVLGPHGGGLRGRVLDPDGTAVAGAEILAGPDGGSMSAEFVGESPEPAYACTAADGTFELGNALPSGKHPVHVAAHGFPLWRGEVEIEEGGTSAIEIRLEHPARIVGRVLGVDGAPVAGVDVLAAEEDRGGWYQDRFAAPEDETDGEGRFELDWVTPGTRELNAHDHRRPGIGRARASVACVAGETATCELRLELGNTISGRLVGADGGPLAGWLVQSDAPMGSSWYPRRGKTDAEGRFTLANLGDGAHDLTVRGSVDDHPRTKVAAVPVGTRDLDIVVADAGATKGLLRARLVAPGEDPASLTVLLWKEGVNEGHWLDADPASGAIEAEVFPGRYRIDVRRGREQALASPLAEVVAGGSADLGDLVLEPAGRLEVELVGQPREIVERLTLQLGREGMNGDLLRPAEGPRLSGELMPGEWTLAASKWVLAPDVVDVLPGVTTRVVVQVSPAVMVALHVVDPTRDSITVEAFDGAGRRRLERTYLPREEDDFRASLGLAPGPARIVVTTRAGLRAEAELDVARDRAPDAVLELVPR